MGNIGTPQREIEVVPDEEFWEPIDEPVHPPDVVPESTPEEVPA